MRKHLDNTVYIHISRLRLALFSVGCAGTLTEEMIMNLH
jgi:hypothetical protein